MTRWVTEATPVSSVERKVIGLASAPWEVAAAAFEVVAGEDVAAAVEVVSFLQAIILALTSDNSISSCVIHWYVTVWYHFS